MVIDTDLAADDIVALYYVMSDPDVDLLAVTVSGTGEVTCPRGADIARGLLAATGRDDVPVACGQPAPLSGDRVFPAEWRTAADKAYGLVLRIIAPPSDPPDAVELMTSILTAAPSPVTLLTLGPLTNVAQALAARPSLVDDLADVVVMGGAVDVAGNVNLAGATAPLAAEWNLYIDPEAAAAVVGSGAPVTLVTLDATNRVPVGEDLVERLAANDRTDATSRVLDLLGAWTPPYLWDPLAAIAATDPALVPAHEAMIAVVTEGEDAGRTIEQADGHAVRVADPPFADAILDHLLRTLAGLTEDDPLVTPTTLPVVGEATVTFDGTTCSYDGPTSLPAGSLVVTAPLGPAPHIVVVAHLVEDATAAEALEWSAAHPNEVPPMIDNLAWIGEGALTSPATVELAAGVNSVVCATEDGALYLAAELMVSG
jgi:pyrimidine-specific ribonucleoside hydrolase